MNAWECGNRLNGPIFRDFFIILSEAKGLILLQLDSTHS